MADESVADKATNILRKFTGGGSAEAEPVEGAYCPHCGAPKAQPSAGPQNLLNNTDPDARAAVAKTFNK